MNPDAAVPIEDEEQVDLVSLWRVLWEQKILVGGVALLCGILTAGVSLLMTPLFRAEVVVTEVRQNNSLGAGLLSSGALSGLANLAGVNLGDNTGSERDARAVLKSRHLTEEFIKRKQLLPLLLRDSKKPSTLWRGVNRFVGDVLSIREDVRQGVTIVRIEWTDPRTAADWANAYVALANEVMRNRALDLSRRNIDYLNREVAKTNVIELERVMYNLIEGETKTLMVANGRIEYAFTVVDPAVAPELRSSPQRTLMTLIGLCAGGVIGATIAFLRNSARNARGAAHPA